MAALLALLCILAQELLAASAVALGEVLFRHGGSFEGDTLGDSLTVHVSRLPVETASLVLINVRSDELWRELVGAVHSEDLRLQRRLKDGQAEAEAGSKLVRIGMADIWQDGPESFRHLLQRQSADPYPLHVEFRRDVAVGLVHPGQALAVSTSPGQRFELEASGRAPAVVAVQRGGELVFTVSGDAILVRRSGAMVRDDERQIAFAAVAEAVRERCIRKLFGHPKDAAYFCNPRFDDRHHVLSRAKYSDDFLMKRLVDERVADAENMQRVSTELRNFTIVGFRVLQGPQEILAKLRVFYGEERLRLSRPEVIHPFNPHLSSYESDTWVLDLPPELKSEADNAFRPLVAEWAGLASKDLLPPVIHGLRLYHNGSLVHRHLDKDHTHALGVIVHIDHLAFGGRDDDGKAEAWPLVIQDHQGQEHQLAADITEEVLLYESATCPHGRLGPFRGREFANLFLHYRPRGWLEATETGPEAEL